MSAPAVDVRQLLLTLLDREASGAIPDSLLVADREGVSHEALVGAMKSLESKSMVVSSLRQREVLNLTAEGIEYAASGTPEFILWQAVPDAGISGKHGA